MSSATQSTTPAELTISAAAAILGSSRGTVYRLVHQGVLRYRLVGLPGSRRPTFRVLADEVNQLRHHYERRTTGHLKPQPRKTTKQSTTQELHYIRLA